MQHAPDSLKRIALAAALVCALTAQVYRPGPQSVTFFSAVDDTDQPYALYLPKDYDAARKYPLVVSLHDAGSNHRLNLRRVFGKGNLPGETDAEATRYFPRFPDVDYIVASPLARGTMGYQGVAEKDVYDVLADVRKRFSIDDDRVYLTGASMGGGGALWLAFTRPDVWAAVAAVCPAAPEAARPYTPNSLNLPMRIYQGALDPLVPPEASRQWHRHLTEAGAQAEYTEYPDIRHNAWDRAYRNAAIFTWFDQFRRNRFPDRVHFVSDHYRHRSAYWIQLDGLTPGTLASIDARFTGPNQIAIQTGNLTAFTLKLAGHPKYLDRRPLAVTIDGARIPANPGVSFERTAKGWRAGAFSPAPGFKRPGAEGPILDAVSAHQIYIYGADGSPSLDELKGRREQTLQAAEGSAAHTKLLLSFRVVSDKEVRPADRAAADLILFGTRETNEQIAKLAPRLPLALNVSAADYGLVFVYPAGAHYALVNSGLPWWTGADIAKRGGLPFIPERIRTLQTFKDYIVFKGSLENVIAEGLFTPDWKVPADHASLIRATGAIEVK